ncbi:MAG: DUF4363 family protein [Clostridia bacterium]|nr:DUF4363 family protein [Clostridia bacterium]
MRSMIITVCISLLLVIAIGVFCGISSLHTSQNFQIRMEEISALISLRRWEEALQHARSAQQDWEEKSPLLSMWVSHENVDEVGIGLSHLSISIQQQEEYHALLYIAEICESLSLIYQKDAFSLKNIF